MILAENILRDECFVVVMAVIIMSVRMGGMEIGRG